MEEVKETLTQFNASLAALLSQMNSLKDEIKKVGEKVAVLENDRESNNPVVSLSTPLTRAKNEYELKEIGRLPDCVKELQVFDGEPDTFVSWLGRAEAILRDYEIIKNRPLYRSILLHIRQKIRGTAETALVSYNVADDDWYEIKRILTLHYADKRDLRTLEHQMSQMNQGTKTIDSFYTTINNHFALILNSLKNAGQSPEVTAALVETYRNRALDVFVRGLNGDMSRLLIIRRPKNLPEAYSICLDLQNISSNVYGSPRFAPPSYRPTFGPRHPWSGQETYPAPGNQPAVGFPRQGNTGRAPQYPQRFSSPRPAIKMEPATSGQSYRSGFSGQGQGSASFKRSPSSSLNPFKKSQRLYQLNAPASSSEAVASELVGKPDNEFYCEGDCPGESPTVTDCSPQGADQFHVEGDVGNVDEVNFMTDASLAFHT